MHNSYIKSHRLLLTALYVALVFLTFSIAPDAAAQAETIPVARVLNADGTLHTGTGVSGALDLRGWNVRLDSARGPVLTPAGSGPSAPLAVTGGMWSPLGSGVGATVLAIAISGSGDVYAGGTFTAAGTCTSGCNNIAKFSGGTWSALGSGVNNLVQALAVSGTDVYAGGGFAQVCGDAACINGNTTVNNIAKYSSGTWSALGSGLNDVVQAIAIGGSDLYAGGFFTAACGITACNSGNTTVYRIAKYSGTTWAPLGTGMNNPVYAIAIDGSNVYAGGGFFSAGTCTSCYNIAQYSGTTWSPLGMGLNDTVYTIAISGSDVYAGGYFTEVCGNATCNGSNTTVNRIAKFSGGTWSALGSGLNSKVLAIAISGSDVYAGGGFAEVCGNVACINGNTTVNNIAKFSGGTWSALGSGVNNVVQAIAASGSSPYAGGGFTTAGNCTVGCNFIAKFGYQLFLPLVVR